MPAGRPTKYDPAFIDRLPELYAQGMSHVEVATELGVSKARFYDYMDKYEEFRDAVKENVSLSEGWWASQGRSNLENPKFRDILWSMNMRNRHGWGEKRKVQIRGFAKAKTPNEKMNCIHEAVERGDLTAEEATQFASLVNTTASVNEKTELAAEVEELKGKMGEQ